MTGPFANLLVRLVAAFGLAMLALGHRFPAPAPFPIAAAFALPGGGAPDLCLSGEGETRFSGGGCDACRIAGASGLPGAPSTWIVAMPAQAVPAVERENRQFAGRAFCPAAPPTAPPARLA